MDIGGTLIGAGLTILVIGVVFRYAPWLVSWFGHLPGDIRYESDHSFVFIPLGSMLVVSVVLSLLRLLFR